VSCLCDGEKAMIKVSDNGNGIPLEFQQKIFEPFFRLDKSGEHNRNSLGLGLAFAKYAIERHGGMIKIDSTPGRGTDVFVTLSCN
jgi:two-component system, OmpR family, phosphate regulon sensor histidine kinase PhoR